MTTADFEQIAADEFSRVPARFAARLKNVALLIEDAPSAATRQEEGLTEHETLLGLYHGVPLSIRGNGYGVGDTLPDTITLYRLPLLEEAELLMQEGKAGSELEAVHLAVRETLWHEIGHAFGMGEEAVDAREAEGTNQYPDGA